MANIFKLTFADNSEMIFQAPGLIECLTSYREEYEDYDEIVMVDVVTEEMAKTMAVINNDYDIKVPDMPVWLTLHELQVGTDFVCLCDDFITHKYN